MRSAYAQQAPLCVLPFWGGFPSMRTNLGFVEQFLGWPKAPKPSTRAGLAVKYRNGQNQHRWHCAASALPSSQACPLLNVTDTSDEPDSHAVFLSSEKSFQHQRETRENRDLRREAKPFSPNEMWMRGR